MLYIGKQRELFLSAAFKEISICASSEWKCFQPPDKAVINVYQLLSMKIILWLVTWLCGWFRTWSQPFGVPLLFLCPDSMGSCKRKCLQAVGWRSTSDVGWRLCGNVCWDGREGGSQRSHTRVFTPNAVSMTVVTKISKPKSTEGVRGCNFHWLQRNC